MAAQTAQIIDLEEQRRLRRERAVSEAGHASFMSGAFPSMPQMPHFVSPHFASPMTTGGMGWMPVWFVPVMFVASQPYQG